ncbi:hypothetical protein GCM10022212_04290 [Actimicrobium antarcticum]|uniref:Uncharacterized protein n=1 Tax=Actimicrobium antarcticum TaxID=1051899 RepID=A0ABP7SLS4_9BURK
MLAWPIACRWLFSLPGSTVIPVHKKAGKHFLAEALAGFVIPDPDGTQRVPVKPYLVASAEVPVILYSPMLP